MTPPTPRSAWRSALPVCLVVFVVNFFTMPAEEYSGDAAAVRIQTVHLLNTGRWDVPAEDVADFGERGQYFHQRKDGRWFPKYGALNTLIYLPPLVLEKAVTGLLETASEQRAFYLNLFNLALSIATAFYLWLIISRFTPSHLSRWLYLLSALYASFWWNYLRAQTFETYQVLFMLGLYYHLVAAPRTHYAASALYLSALFLSKEVYVVLLAPMVFLIKPTRISFWLPVALLLAVMLWINSTRFDSPLDTGYTQWSQEQQLFSWNLWPGARGFLFEKQTSVFLHFPLLLIAIPFYPRFFKTYPRAATAGALLALTLFVVNAAFLHWRGGSCYGPRHLLVVLPILSLPALCFIDWIKAAHGRLTKAIAGSLAAMGLSYSLFLQLSVNTLPFFTWYELKSVLPDGPTEEKALGYLTSHSFGTINADLIAFARGKPSPIFDLFVAPRIDRRAIADFLVASARPNYYWLQGAGSSPTDE